MGTDAARLAGRGRGKKKVQREAEKMNSCASRAHTSNFHFALAGSGSRRAVAGPRAIPRDTSELRDAAHGTLEIASAILFAAKGGGQRPKEKGEEKKTRARLRDRHHGVAWIRAAWGRGKGGGTRSIDRSIFIDLRKSKIKDLKNCIFICHLADCTSTCLIKFLSHYPYKTWSYIIAILQQDCNLAAIFAKM